MKRTLKPYAPFFLLPTVIAFGIAFLVPFFMGLYLSFTKFNTLKKITWVGLDNYKRALQDDSFLHSFWFTTLVVIVSVILVNLFAFSIAKLLTQKLRGTNFFRTVYFMPNLIGGIVLGYTWNAIINGVLRYYNTTIQNDSIFGFWGLILLVCWQQVGYMMVIYIAGLQNVPPELNEAAEIDGAGRWQILRNVTIPMIMPTITICLFLTLSSSFKMFDQNLALTNGAPGKETMMVALNIYNTMFVQTGKLGLAQAKAVLFVIVVVVVALLQLRATRSKEVEA